MPWHHLSTSRSANASIMLLVSARIPLKRDATDLQTIVRAFRRQSRCDVSSRSVSRYPGDPRVRPCECGVECGAGDLPPLIRSAA